MRRVYLDWNATTPPTSAVLTAMARAGESAWGNPSSTHANGRAARSEVEAAREAVARLGACDSRDVILTSGGTEANNIAIRSAFEEGGGVLVASRAEHPSVTRVAEALEREGKARVLWVSVRRDGVVDLDAMARALDEPGVRLLALQAVNPETGVVQPVGPALALARARRVRVHVDAVQAFGRVEELGAGADTRSLAAHKLRGPKAIGALLCGPGVRLAPVLVGGSQERGLRPGALDPMQAAGLAVAASHARLGAHRYAAVEPLRDRLEREIVRAVPGARINGAVAKRAPHVSSIAFPGWSGPELVAALDLEGVSVSSGSACSAGTAEPSPVLLAMGDREAASSSVRYSLGEDTKDDDVAFAIDVTIGVARRAGPRDSALSSSPR